MHESHFFGLFLVHQEVDGLALVAEFTFQVRYFCTDIGQITNLLRNLCPDSQFGLSRRNRLAELYIQLNGIAACL